MAENAGGASPQQCDECGQRWIHLQGCSRFGSPVPHVACLAHDVLLQATAMGIAALNDASTRLERCRALLLRCESNIPPHLVALLTDIRAELGIDARGFRVDPEHKG
jgi:hypothetical protein